MKRNARLDPQILFAGEPHAAAEQERHFLPLGKADPELLPRQLAAGEIEGAGLAELRGFGPGDQRRHAVNELRAVEKACRRHGPAIEDEGGERRGQAQGHEPFQHVTPAESVCTVRAAGMVRQCAHMFLPGYSFAPLLSGAAGIQVIAHKG